MAITKTSSTYTGTQATGQTTFTAKSSGVTNAVICASFIASNTVSFTAISGTGFTWSQIGSGYTSTIAGGNNWAQLWLGRVTSVQSTAVTCTATSSASVAALYCGFEVIGEFTAGSTSTTWTVDTTGTRVPATAASIVYPTLSAAQAGELYVGNGSTGSGGAGGTTGSPSPFVFNTTAASQGICYGILTASGSTGTITQAKSASSSTSAYGALLRATVPATPTGQFFPFLS